jgi:hypothetical protein
MAGWDNTEKVVSKADVAADNLISNEFLIFKIFMEMKTKLLITGLAFMAMTTLLSAQTQGTGQRQMNGKGTAFVDANKNGICDNYENSSSNSKATAGNANCQGNGRGQRHGQGQGSGQRGMRQGRRNQNNFVDADKNGICDFRETPAKK